MKKVSIVVPAFNCEKHFAKTIESILNQSYTNFELLIVDDGSTDATKSVIESFDDKRISYFYQNNHGGPSKARNKGLDAASGEYIFIFDSDDLMHPDKLKLSVAAFDQEPAADILFTRFSLIDEQENILREDYLKEYVTLSKLIEEKRPINGAYYIEKEELLFAVVKTNFIGTSSVCLRASALDKRFHFDESLKNADDRLFWISFIASHNGIFLNSILHAYRVVASGITGQGMLKKGPYKIMALEKAKKYCDKRDLKRMLNEEISRNYLAMSRESKQKKNFQAQRQFAVKSIQYKLSWSASKLLISACLRGIV